MTLRVGVIGTGMIGQDHIRRLTQVVSGAAVVAVSDANEQVAKEVASQLPDSVVHATGEELIADERVDAVIVCSWGPSRLAVYGTLRPFGSFLSRFVSDVTDKVPPAVYLRTYVCPGDHRSPLGRIRRVPGRSLRAFGRPGRVGFRRSPAHLGSGGGKAASVVGGG